MKPLLHTPDYDTLKQEADRTWLGIQVERAHRAALVAELMKSPWRCPSCGTGGLIDPICPSCRSARIVELE